MELAGVGVARVRLVGLGETLSPRGGAANAAAAISRFDRRLGRAEGRRAVLARVVLTRRLVKHPALRVAAVGFRGQHERWNDQQEQGKSTEPVNTLDPA